MSNAFSEQPLTLSDFHLAERASGASIVTSTDRSVTFGGQTSVTIPAHGEVISDPVPFPVRAESDVVISFYLPERAQGVSTHDFSFQENYLADGDVAGAADIAVRETIWRYIIISDLDVLNIAATGTLVAFGASITEGHNSSGNANQRYTNLLATRLNASGRTVGVANEGVAGNQLLGVGIGQSALDRFDRDVLSRSGVRWVIFADNPINDLASGREPTGEQLIGGLRQLIDRAHAAGVSFFCATLTPFEGNEHWRPAREVARSEYNAFVRSAGSGCDAVIDFDRATHDPAAPTRFLPAYDAGDHLHPNNAGMAAMANAVALGLFGPAIPEAPTTLAEAFNNIGVTSDTNTGPGNFDGGGASFSGQALAAGGAVPGGSVTTGGVSLTWPATAGTGQPDNAIATGQLITVPGSGNTLAFLYSASYGGVSGTGTIHYSDGTTQTYRLDSPDWFVSATTEATVAVVASYQNRQGNVRYDAPSAVFSAQVPLASGKALTGVRLPVAGGAPVQAGLPTLHIFAAVVTNR
ncbi:GDSL-type esterase/lipase family protein [Micromonospora sp. NPDC049366]|uniref:GDSL-type esterase/lipase family protein n=1 Tax=Micromonospora sp. NPDC049366 TaxID=3364271 RepID=UPI00379A4BA9